MKKSTQAVDSILAGKTRRPSVQVLGHHVFAPGLARVLVDVVHTSESRDNHAEVVAAIEQVFDNQLSCVCGSFHSVDKAPYSERISGVVRVNAQAIPYTEDIKGFRSLSTNIFMDEEEKMWALRRTDAGDLLVKSTGIEDHDSLRGLLDVVCSNNRSLSSAHRAEIASLSSLHQSVEGGDFVQYVSESSQSLRLGYVVATDPKDGKLLVLASDAPVDSEGETIDRQAITASFDQSEFPATKLSEQEQMDIAVSAARGVVDISAILAYYKKVFARGPAFYEQFAQRVRSHAFC